MVQNDEKPATPAIDDHNGSLTNTDRLVIYETWQSEADLKAHMASEHFRRLVPAIEEVATLTLERFDF